MEQQGTSAPNILTWQWGLYLHINSKKYVIGDRDYDTLPDRRTPTKGFLYMVEVCVCVEGISSRG